MRSEPAFDAEYGDRGSSGSVSRNEPSSIDPYTSSVEMWRNRSTPTRRATSHITFVPSQFVWTNSSGLAIDRSTWLSAAKCTTASWPSIAAVTASRSVMLPFTKANRGSSSRPWRFSRFPA